MPFVSIAPPPPPPSPDAAPVEPVTVKAGDKKEKVIAAFGQPKKVVSLPTQEIDYNDDMKVIYVNGKVSSVQ
jgi:hypothetical protein